MKKSNLSIEKFRIAKLNNLSKIIGGNLGDGGGQTGTGDDVKVNKKCVFGSLVKIEQAGLR